MSMKVQWLPFALSLVLAGCAANLMGAQLMDIPPAEKPTVPTNEQECSAAGAFWIEQGLPGGSKSCAVRTTDSRKICTDGAQCQGACLVSDALPAGSKAIGSCSDWVATFGCHKFIEGGLVREICAD